MGEKPEQYYKVTSGIEFTVRAGSESEATEAADTQIMAMLEETAVADAIRGSFYSKGALTATKIEYDAEELAKMERWLAAHPNK